MEFVLTEQQEMLRKMARDFLDTECPKSLVREMVTDEKGYPDELWQKMAELGWMGLIIPEEYGGEGASFYDLAVVLEEMGRACLPGPFFSTVVLGGLTILDAGSDKQKQELLPRLAQGKLVLTLALTETEARYTPGSVQVKAQPKGDEFVIQGTKLFTPDVHVADYIICVARTKESNDPEDGLTLFLVDSRSSGISYVPLQTISGDKQFEVVFDSVKVSRENILGKLDEGWTVMARVLEKAAVARCVEMVGGTRQVLEMTVDYARERVQFGRPIGALQAIQHHCANIAIDVDSCALLSYQAAWRVSEGMPAGRETAMAKAWISDRFKRLATVAHQVHGAIGFTEDHDMPLYYKRAKTWELSLGDANYHFDKVATELGL